MGDHSVVVWHFQFSYCNDNTFWYRTGFIPSNNCEFIEVEKTGKNYCSHDNVHSETFDEDLLNQLEEYLLPVLPIQLMNLNIYLQYYF